MIASPASSFFSRLNGAQRSASFSEGQAETPETDVRRAKSMRAGLLESMRVTSFAEAGSNLSSPAPSERYTPPPASRHPLFSHHASPPTVSDPGPSVPSSPSSGAFSPASAFLSHFSSNSSLRPPTEQGARVLEYTLGKLLGRGGFSTVRLATHDNGEVFACKIVKRDDLSDRSGSLEKFEEEIRIWRSLPRHPSLLPLLEMHRTPFATFLFSPFLPGSLLDVMRREGGSDKTARKWFPGVVAAVSALHEGCEGFEGRVLHGDLKLDNFLVDHSGGVIVCDFYMAQIVDTVPLPRPRVFHPLESLPPSLPSASLPYAPPELLRAPPPPPSLAQDIWALGVILHALLTGKLPFVDAFDPRLQMKILRGQWDPPLYLGKEWLECLRGCLDGNRETRWDIRRVRECDAVIGWHEVKSRSRSRSRHRPSEYEYGADPLTGRSDVFSRNRSRSASATRRLVGFDPEKQVATNLETMSISRGRSATRQQLMPTPVPPIITTFERGRPGTPSPSRRASRSPHATITAPSNPDSRSRSRTPWEERFGGMELGVVDEETGYRSRKGRSGSRGRGT